MSFNSTAKIIEEWFHRKYGTSNPLEQDSFLKSNMSQGINKTCKPIILYGPSRSGKKTALAKILHDKGYTVTVFADTEGFKTFSFVDVGLYGPHAYIFDIDSLRFAPAVPKGIVRAPVFYTCVNPWEKKNTIKKLDNYQLVKLTRAISIQYLDKTEPLSKVVHSKDISTDTPPWEIIRFVSNNNIPFDKRLTVAAVHKRKLSYIIANNAIRLSGTDIRLMEYFAENCSSMDANYNHKTPLEYIASMAIMCPAIHFNIQSGTRLDYKSSARLPQPIPKLTRKEIKDKIYGFSVFGEETRFGNKRKGKKRTRKTTRNGENHRTVKKRTYCCKICRLKTRKEVPIRHHKCPYK